MDARYWVQDSCYDSSRHAYQATNTPAIGPCEGSELALLADSASHLRNMQAALTLVQARAPPLPVTNPSQPLVDDRLAFVGDRARKSILDPHAFNKMGSEWYPIQQPPLIELVRGTNTRLIDRPPGVVLR